MLHSYVVDMVFPVEMLIYVNPNDLYKETGKYFHPVCEYSKFSQFSYVLAWMMSE